MQPDASPAEGHNSVVGGVSADRLRSIVERVEAAEIERKEISNHIKEVFLEAKSDGFSVQILRQIIRIRAQDPNERQELETLLEVYKRALGMT